MLNPDFRDMLSALSEHDVDYLVVEPMRSRFTDCLVRPATSTSGCGVHTRTPSAPEAALQLFGAQLAGIAIEGFESPGNVIQIGVAPPWSRPGADSSNSRSG